MKRRRLMVAGVLVVGVMLITAGVVFAAGVGSVNNGTDSTADGDYSTVAGGFKHEASGYAAIVGGGHNHATGDYSIVLGGGCCTPDIEDPDDVDGFLGNSARGDWSVVLGGSGNWASGEFSLTER